MAPEEVDQELTRFRALAEQARDAIVEITAEARLLYANRGFGELFGWDPEEILGKIALEYVHPEDLPLVDEIRVRAFEQEAPAQVVFRFRHRDGSYRWVELSGRPYRNEEGELRAVLVSRDVTDRVEAQRALREQLEVESRIARLARRFLDVGPEGFDECMEEGLGVAAAVAGAQRAQFYAVGPKGIRGFYQWHVDGAEPRSRARVEGSLDAWGWSSAILLAGEVLHVPEVAELPEAARAEREGLSGDGVLSYLAIPIHHDNRAVGFLDFFRCDEARAWSKQEITRLSLIADVFASAVRRLRAEERRRASDERFRTLARHAQDTICEMTLDGQILHVSRSLEELGGYTVAEVGQLDLAELIHPDDRARTMREVHEALSARGVPPPITYRIWHRNGSWRWLETTLGRYESDAGVGRIALVIRDVTEREARREDLERQLELEQRVAHFSRALLERGADQVDEGIRHGLEAAAGLAEADRAYLVTGDEAGRPVSFDWLAPGVTPRQHKFGPHGAGTRTWVVERLRRNEMVKVPRVADLPAEAAAIRERLESDGIRSYLCLPITDDGALIGVLGFHCVTAEKDWSERELTLLGVVADLFTAAIRRKRTEDELQESHRRLLQAQKMEAVGTLAGGIAHDFNNQLTVMLSNARYAMRHAQGDDEVQRALADLNSAAEHCAQLTRSLLAFARRTPAAPRMLAVDEVLSRAGSLLQPLVPRSIDFELACESEDASVIADPTQLQQVLVNLVVNARDAMPEGGRITLRGALRAISPDDAGRLGLPRPGSYVEFAVCDTGVGMTEAVRSRIFEPFFTTKPMGKGTGLGLATAWGIIEDAGGAIALESEPGRGSTFRVLLPSAEGIREETAPEVSGAAPAGSGTVLLAEDEDSVRRLLSRILRRAGYDVVEARDGQEALERSEGVELDAVVTDLDMPRLDGVQLARRLSRERPGLPILLVSGSAPDPLAGADLPVDRCAFLAKPFTEEVLLGRLVELLGD